MCRIQTQVEEHPVAIPRRTFPTGGLVEPDDLVDREAILDELLTRTFEHGNSVVVSGPRQIGKSSVAEELKRRVRKAGGWGIYMDFSAVTGDERELAAFVARATYDQAAGSIGAFTRLRDFISGVPKPVFYQSDLDLAVMFHGSQQQPASALIEGAFGLADTLAAQKGKRAVVVFDEFQELRKISPQIFSRVRAVLQHHMTHTAYVFMGSDVGMLNAMFRDPRKMPFGLAVSINFGLPTPDAWRAYIEGRFAKLGVSLRPGEADELISFTGGHPRDLMEACEHLLTLRSLNREADGAVKLAEEKTLNSLRVKFDELWRRLERPAGTQTTAGRIANGQPIYGRGRPQKSVSRTIEKLGREGIVRRVGRGAYEFTEPLFARYIRELTEQA
jgi:uncharacterized protein